MLEYQYLVARKYRPRYGRIILVCLLLSLAAAIYCPHSDETLPDSHNKTLVWS